MMPFPLWPERINNICIESGKKALSFYGDDTAPFDYLAGGSLFAKHFGTRSKLLTNLNHPFGGGGLIKKMFGIPGNYILMNSQRDRVIVN